MENKQFINDFNDPNKKVKDLGLYKQELLSGFNDTTTYLSKRRRPTPIVSPSIMERIKPSPGSPTRRPIPSYTPPVRPSGPSGKPLPKLPVKPTTPERPIPDRPGKPKPTRPINDIWGRKRQIGPLTQKPAGGVWSTTRPSGTPISRWTAVMPPQGFHWEFNQITGQRKAVSNNNKNI